jgi:PKD repeat protein
MKRILLPLLTFALFSCFGPLAMAQTIATCQDLTVQLDANGDASLTDPLSFVPEVDVYVDPSNGAPETNTVWQSFTSSVSGILHRITLDVEQLNAPSAIMLTVFSGQGTGGTVLHTQSIASLIVGTNVFTLNTTLDLVAGNVYTFRVASGAGTFYPQRNNTNLYAGGISSLGAGFDLICSTFMLQRPSIDNGSTSTDGIASFAVSNNTFDCSDLGPVNVTLTVTSNLGATAQCVATIAVEDNIDPVANCVATSLLSPLVVTLDANGDGTLLLADVNNGSSDNCSFTSTLSQSIFDCSDVDMHTITLTVTDPASNAASCNVFVEVVDNVLPNAICQDITLQLDANGQASTTPANIDNGSNDACGIASYALDIQDFDCSNIGANTVTLTVIDVNGNSNTCTSTVTIEDVTPPVITCAADIVVCATDGNGATITYGAPSATDNCNYSITQTDASGLASGSTFPVGTTTIEYTVTDDGGNTDVCSFDVTVDAKPVAAFTFTPACVGEVMFFNSTSTIQNGYQIVSWTWDMGDGSSPIGQVNPLYQYPAAGDYDVTLTVVTANGCSDVITQTVTVTPSPAAAFTVAPVCLGAQTSFMNATTIDPIYNGALSYTWNFGDGSPVSNDIDPVHTYATSGTFTVTLTVVSDDGCTDQIQLPALVSALPQAQFVAGNACEGNATQFTDLSFGTSLTYDWQFGDGNTSTLQNPTNVYATSGTFSTTLTVTAPGGCTSTITNNVNVIPSPVVSFSFASVCEGNAVTFTNASDAGVYGWDFDDNSSSILGNPSHVFAEDGFYDVTLSVVSSQSCTASLTQVVEIYRNPEFTLTPTAVSCFGESTGSINILAVLPSTTPWEVSINGAPSITDEDNFTALAAGTYTITIVDANNCTNSGQTTVTEPTAPLALDAPVLTDLQCNGDNSGSLAIEANGGTAPYTYALSSGAPQADGLFTGLAAGDYYIEVIDANGCDLSTNFFTINEPAALLLTLQNSSDLLCSGDNTGSLTVEAAGGTAPYIYNLNGGFFGQSPTFSGLDAGDKTIIVIDDNGCAQVLNVTLSEPGILQLSVVNSSDALCSGQATGTVTVSAASGTAPYQYSFDGENFQGTGIFQGLFSGSYTFTAQDANGCLDQVTYTVGEPNALTVATTSAPVLCFGGSTGSASITVGGGTLPYTYSYDGGTTFINQSSVSTLPAGNYVTVVRDANGCTASQGIQITQPAVALELTATVTDVACLGAASGAVQLLALGGTPTYAYSVDGVVFQNSGIFTGLSAGDFTYYTMDLNNCVANTTVTIIEPATSIDITNAVVSNPSCGLSTDGTVTVQANGGTPGYTYSSDGIDYQANALLTGLGVGSQLVYAQDANGCVSSESVTLTSAPALVVNVLNVVGVECAGTFTGQLELSGDGGIPDYTFSLSGGAPQASGSFNELTNGVYVVTMTDANGCSTTAEVDLPATYPVPAVEFNWVAAGEAVFFENLSEFGDTYFWDFGDGTSSTEENPVHIYALPGYYTVTLSVTNGCGTRTRTKPVNTVTIGIEDTDNSTFTLYPNPATDMVFITTGKDIIGTVSIEVTAITGQRVMDMSSNGLMSNGRIGMDVSILDQGMYHITVQTENGRSVMRFNVIR